MIDYMQEVFVLYYVWVQSFWRSPREVNMIKPTLSDAPREIGKICIAIERMDIPDHEKVSAKRYAAKVLLANYIYANLNARVRRSRKIMSRGRKIMEATFVR
jgi:hypothetical protein